MTTIERARAYLTKMPLAVSGQGGHTAAFNAATATAIGFDLSDDDALAILSEWNASCAPPWTERELRQKIASARRDCRRAPGYLNHEPTSHTRTAPDFESDAEQKARQRLSWPQFKPLKHAGLEAVARLRKLPLRAVIHATRTGFLSGGMVEGYRCFIIHENTFAQARRLDGQPFKRADGTEIKAKNLPGAQGAFIGTRWLGGPSVNVLLVEGCVTLLEALAAHEITDPRESWTILAATSASSRFARAPELLAALAGRFVRIIPDADEAGQNAAASWLADLEAAGAQVDALALPDGFKDLGGIIANADAHHEPLNAIFA